MGDQLTVRARLVQGPLGHTLVVLTISGDEAPPLIEVSLYRSATVSKTPTWRIRRKPGIEGERSTDSNGPIGSTNDQWG